MSQLSASEYIFGRFDYKVTPLAPPGTKVVVYSKPLQRGPWDLHGVIGFYIGPAMKHYRYFKCFVPATKFKRITDTVTFMEHNIPIPQMLRAEEIQQSLQKNY